MGKRIFEVLLVIVLLGILLAVGLPKYAALLHNKAEGCYSAGKHEEAIRYYKLALKLAPKSSITHFGLGNAYMETKREKDAVLEYSIALELDKGNLPAARALSRIYADRALFEGALEILKTVRKVSPDDNATKDLFGQILEEYAQDCLDKGTEAFISGNKQEGYLLVNKALNLKPDFLYAYYSLAVMHYFDSGLEPAKGALTKALEIDAGFLPAHKLLGDIYFTQGRFADAHYHYLKAVSGDSIEPDLYHNLGLALMNLERYSEALQYLRKAVELAPEDMDLLYSLASVYRDSARPQEAIREYKKLLSKAPDFPNAHNDLGDIFTNLKRKEEAASEYAKEIASCRRALKDTPKNIEIMNNLAYALCAIGEVSEARAVINNAIALGPDYRQARLTCAKIYERSGDTASAISELDIAKKLSSESNFIDREKERIRQKVVSGLDKGKFIK